MIISHRFRFILYNNPLTGSSRIRDALAFMQDEVVQPYHLRTPRNPFYTYMPPAEVAQTMEMKGLPYDDYVSITCIRDPFTRLPALYERIKNTDRLWKFRQSAGLMPPHFVTWLNGTLTEGRGGGGAPHARWRRCGTWSIDNWTGGKVRHVIKAEDAQNEITRIFVESDLPPANLPSMDDISRVTPGIMTRVARKIISERYEADIAKFGYTPPCFKRAA